MARILLPTDFSDTSMHAAEYAVHLFGKANHTYILLHAYMDLGLSGPVMPSLMEEMLSAAEDGIRDHTDRFVRRTGAEGVRQEVRYGQLPAVLNDYAGSEGADVVVMGNRGKGASAFFGSSTIDVINRSRVPVLAVPESAELKPAQRILLADDYDDILPRNLDILRRMAIANRSEVLVGHVEMEMPEATPHWSDGIYELALQGIPHSFHQAHGEDVVDGLARLARHKHVDMIAVLHRHIGLLGRLFHQSTAKDLAKEIELPLLVLEQSSNG